MIVASAAFLFGAIPRDACAQEVLPPSAAAVAVPIPEKPPAQFGDSHHLSPGLAVVLSLQPLPVDFGNLYAENLGWGVAYTAIEVSLMAPMMWLGASHMSHMDNDYRDDRRWSDNEKAAMIGLVVAYVAVKLVAGVHAGYAATAFNRRNEGRPMAFVLPTAGGAAFGWEQAF